MSGVNSSLAFRQIADEQRVAVLAFAALGDRQDREPLVVGRLDRVEALRVRRILVDERVVRTAACRRWWK